MPPPTIAIVGCRIAEAGRGAPVRNEGLLAAAAPRRKSHRRDPVRRAARAETRAGRAARVVPRAKGRQLGDVLDSIPRLVKARSNMARNRPSCRTESASSRAAAAVAKSARTRRSRPAWRPNRPSRFARAGAGMRAPDDPRRARRRVGDARARFSRPTFVVVPVVERPDVRGIWHRSRPIVAHAPEQRRRRCVRPTLLRPVCLHQSPA
jgi:hypothetical protein